MITYNEVVADIEEIVAQKGADFVYKPGIDGSCLYFHGDEPGCIVGCWLALRGIAAEDMQDINSSITADGAIPILQARGLLDSMEDRAFSFLCEAQAHQDHFYPWGETVVLAKEVVESD
jgi:hypothetical protein